MSFPFGPDVRALRQRILFAIGGSGLVGLGAIACNSIDDGSKDAGSMMQPNSNTSGKGGSASAGRGGSGTTTAGSGMAGSTSAGKGGTAVTCPLMGSMPMQQCFARTEMENKARFGCGQIQKMPMPTDEQVADAFLDNGCLPKDMACDGSCCYTFCPGACCGRSFEVGGELRLAGVQERSDWLGSSAERVLAASGLAVGATLARRIAREWLEDGAMEHASIASFARFTLDLLSAGAPAELLALAQRAALDEVAHAQACFALASRYAGSAFGPSALATADARPATSLQQAVRSAFREGCIGETLAAAHARAALTVALDGDVRHALARIADDEARHAELAWRFVAWGLPHCDPSARAELQAELARAIEQQPAPANEYESEEIRAVLHAAGRLTATERAALGRRALREVVVPCAEALLS